MKRIPHKKLLFVLFVFVVFVLPVSVAQGVDKVTQIINNVSTWFLTIIAALAILMFLLGAFSYMTSGGDAEKLKKGKNYLLYGAIGLAIAFMADAIVRLIKTLVK